MAKIIELKDRNTGEVILPKTITSNVYTSSGNKLSEELDKKAEIEDLPNVTSEEVIDNPLLEEINTLTRERIKKDLFIDMWDSVNGFYAETSTSGGEKITQYIPESDTFLVHCSADSAYDIELTYMEALRVYAGLTTEAEFHYNPYSVGFRVMLPPLNYQIGSGPQYVTISKFAMHSYIEVVYFAYGRENAPVANVSVESSESGFILNYHSKLKAVIGQISVRSIKAISCPVLEYFRIKGITKDCDLAGSPKVRLDSFEYLVNRATNTTPITITVHADVYAKLTGDTSNAAAAALTEEELAQWQQLVVDAAAKDITFVTTE